MSEIHTKQLQDWIASMRQGDDAAQNDLLRFACDRLQKLAHKMLQDFATVRRWEQTDDVVQKATLRLWRALQTTTPQSIQHFMNLAALHIRRELIDLSRHYTGPEGLASHHATDVLPTEAETSSQPKEAIERATQVDENLSVWTAFHEEIAKLPAEELEVFNCLWYNGLSQAETAQALQISERTVQRRWQSARLRVYEALGGELPE